MSKTPRGTNQQSLMGDQSARPQEGPTSKAQRATNQRSPTRDQLANSKEGPASKAPGETTICQLMLTPQHAKHTRMKLFTDCLASPTVPDL